MNTYRIRIGDTEILQTVDSLEAILSQVDAECPNDAPTGWLPEGERFIVCYRRHTLKAPFLIHEEITVSEVSRHPS